MRTTLLVILLVNISFFSQAQTLADLDLIDSAEVHCYDKGGYMRGCAADRYSQVDSILNVAYKNFITKQSDADKIKFRNEQIAWLKMRDIQFKKIAKEQEKDMGLQKYWHNDAYMVYDDSCSEVIEKRAIYFIKKLN